MNQNLYKNILENGLTLKSPSAAIGSNALSEIRKTEEALKPFEALGTIDSNVLRDTKNALNIANTGLSSSVSHITNSANKSLQHVSLAKQVNRLDSTINLVPSSCFNSEALFGSVTGACDHLFNGISDMTKGITAKISGFVSGVISQLELEAYLKKMSGLINAATEKISDLLKAETELLNEILSKIKASSLAQSIEALWNDPCAKSILNQTLPAEIKAFI